MLLEASAEQKAEELARMAAERAVSLATVAADKAQAIAVERAVRDANIDRDILQHAQRLDAINGSQRKMAESLASVETTLKEIVTTSQAVAAHITSKNASQISRRAVVFGILTTVASYLAILALLITSVH